MKKINLFIFLLSFPLLLNAQWIGDGLTSGTAYYGVINGSNTMQTWNLTNYPTGVIYVGRSTAGQNDLEVASGGTLTIEAGITVKFCTTASDLRITGTGILNASGSSASSILFTKDTQANWGHISFEASTGTSVINFCTIEYGLKTGAGIEGYGGGIHANTNALTISNSNIRNNYAQYGGGIFVNQNMHPAISNCYVYNNQSMHAGGGFYCWNGSSSVITNCVFDSNHCLETTTPYYTGGGLAAQSGCSIKVINCTFVNNTSTQPEGKALLLHGSSNSKVLNSIFWGSSLKQVYCYNTPGTTIINSAYCGVTYTMGSAPLSSVVLNISNNATDGPNFIATDGSDWSLKYISPCRDAGINFFTGVTIPMADYLGKPAIGTKDIGAFEVQYSKWTGSIDTDWGNSGNWIRNIDPSVGSGDVVIPTGLPNYPTGSSPDFTIGSGKQMIIEQGARVALNNLTNNGSLKMYADATGFASLLMNGYTKGAGSTEEIQLYLAGGGTVDDDNLKWHYISSPIDGQSTSIFSAVSPDVAQWVESRPVTDPIQGWVAFDGWIYSTSAMGGPTFNSLSLGKGYNFFDYVDHTVTLSGQINTSSKSVPLSYTNTAPLTYKGYNLLGNPFTSGMDWDYIILNSFPANTSKAVYFTSNNIWCSYVNHVGSPSGVNGIIPPMQGFFTKTNSAGNTIVLAKEACTNTGIHQRYSLAVRKGLDVTTKSSDAIQLVRLATSEDTTGYDDMVIRFDESADQGLDNDFDAVKLLISLQRTQIYSETGGVKYAINGIPFPDSLIEIPVTVNYKKAGNHTISASQFDGLSGYSVTLTDKTTGFVANLRTTPAITFSAPAGLITGRFVLKVGSILTGIDDNITSKSNFNIYYSYNNIMIQTLGDEWEGKNGTVTVIDLTGKVISTLNDATFSKNSLLSIPATPVTGIYIVEIQSGSRKYIGKVVVRK